MPRQVFTAGEILTAANMNDLSDQTVMVFDTSAARGSAIPTPSEGMVTYLKDVNQVQAFDGSAFAPVGTILQVVSTTKTDTFQTTATTPTDITGATVSITPTSTSSKVFVTFNFRVSHSTVAAVAVQLLRDSTVIGGGAVVGSRLSAVDVTTVESGNRNQSLSGSFLDSPSSSSSVTYSLKVFSTGGTLSVGRPDVDTDNAQAVNTRTPVTITAMEVAG